MTNFRHAAWHVNFIVTTDDEIQSSSLFSFWVQIDCWASKREHEANLINFSTCHHHQLVCRFCDSNFKPYISFLTNFWKLMDSMCLVFSSKLYDLSFTLIQFTNLQWLFRQFFIKGFKILIRKKTFSFEQCLIKLIWRGC